MSWSRWWPSEASCSAIFAIDARIARVTFTRARSVASGTVRDEPSRRICRWSSSAMKSSSSRAREARSWSPFASASSIWSRRSSIRCRYASRACRSRSGSGDPRHATECSSLRGLARAAAGADLAVDHQVEHVDLLTGRREQPVDVAEALRVVEPERRVPIRDRPVLAFAAEVTAVGGCVARLRDRGRSARRDAPVCPFELDQIDDRRAREQRDDGDRDGDEPGEPHHRRPTPTSARRRSPGATELSGGAVQKFATTWLKTRPIVVGSVAS